MTTVATIGRFLESHAPVPLQESYDNAGLIVGDPNMNVNGVLIALDCTEEVIDEAISKKANLVIAHHPIVFKGLKSITGKSYVERTIIKAIKNDIAIYAIHTNLDNISTGVNNMFANKLGLVNTQILRPLQNLEKLVVFVPEENTNDVLEAMHGEGAGDIGEYSGCSFRVAGKGRFTPGVASNPTIGEALRPEEVIEDRIELILPSYLSSRVIEAMKTAHPYEEVAYYLSQLSNYNQTQGAGAIGELAEAMSVDDFLEFLKSSMDLELVKYTPFSGMIKKVAVCGGSGSFLLSDAKRMHADAFITADVKYHEFFDAEKEILFCDIGHYESEVNTKELLGDLLTKKFTTFALHLSEYNSNPIKYYN